MPPWNGFLDDHYWSILYFWPSVFGLYWVFTRRVGLGGTEAMVIISAVAAGWWQEHRYERRRYLHHLYEGPMSLMPTYYGPGFGPHFDDEPVGTGDGSVSWLFRHDGT